MKQIGSLLLLLVLLLSGCGGVSKEEYDAVVRERDALLAEAELRELQAPEAVPVEVLETVTVKVKGDFTATVRALIPDYVTDDETPRMAVVTLFQSTPFTLFGVDADRLEVGETYVFEVEMDRCQDITREEYESGSLLTPEIILPMYHPYIRISGFRLAEEKDCGLDSVHLEYELYES